MLASDQPALQATQQSVHCVLLIVQPLECADDAGFTLVPSHCCARLSVRLSCSPSYFYTLFICKFFRYVSGDWANSIIRNLDGGCTTTPLINKYVSIGVNLSTYISSGEQKS